MPGNNVYIPFIVLLATLDKSQQGTCYLGPVVVNAAGGNGNYSFSIDSINYSKNNSFYNVPTGFYIFHVVDALGCRAITNGSLIGPIFATVSVTNNTCFGASNGSAVITMQDGTPDYNIRVNDTYATAYNISGIQIVSLTAQTYQYSATDALGCVYRDSFVIGEPPEIPAPVFNRSSGVPTSGGQMVLVGNFSSPASFYFVDSLPEKANCSFNHSIATCTVGPGTGVHQGRIYVGLNGCQKNVNLTWQYASPRIVSASAMYYSGGIITITGEDFGSDPSVIIVTAQGKICVNCALTSQTTVVCKCPGGVPDIASNITISVSALTSAPYPFSFVESCGDSICNPNLQETCSTCFFDCGSCSYPKCKGSPECSSHGDCVKGVCVCRDAWSGPDCSVKGTIAINVTTTNDTKVVISPENSQVVFNVAILQILEVEPSGNIVRSFNLPEFTGTKTKDIITLPDNSLATRTSYNSSLPNRALFFLSLIEFPKATEYPFANLTITVPDNSVKFSIEVRNWPFSSIRNRLEIVIQTNGASPKDTCQITQTSSDGSQNLQWFKVVVDGISLYATFLQDSVLDGAPGRTSISFESTKNRVTLSVPSFWESAVIDPVYSVLVDPNDRHLSCHSKSVKKAIIGGVIGGVLGAALLAALIGFLVKAHRRRKRNEFFTKSSEKFSQTELQPIK